ncbi:MAG: glycosyltransferase family 39 protein [Chloroflexota bacterium]|nr:glycosyltransferase family 39 protein [Dehalococcoidia bacterium]MDW8253065.1 glycosyltransferase family 39 protein [Chloroflexota bacterium]
MQASSTVSQRRLFSAGGAGVALLLAAFALRISNLGSDSFWMDELNTALVSAQPLSAILRWNLDVGVHPPGHLILVHFWQRLVGGSEFALRLLSLIAGTLAVAAAYRLALDLFNLRAAVIAALLLTFSNLMIYFARENRAYAWLSMLGVLAVLVTQRALQRGGGVWLVLLGILTLAPYLHYYGVFVAVLAGGAVIASLPALPPGQRWRPIGRFALVVLGAAALYLPWVPGAQLQLHNRPDLGYFWPNSLSAFLDTLAAITPDLPVWLPVSVIAYAVVRRTSRPVLFLAAVLAIGVGAVLLLNAFKATLFFRNVILFLPVYTVLFSGALLVLAADLARWMSLRRAAPLRSSLIAQGVLVSAVALSLVQAPPTLAWKAARPDWRGVARMLDAEATPADLILVAQWPFTLTYYLTNPRLVDRVQDALNTNDALASGPWTFDQPATVWWVILGLESKYAPAFAASLGEGYEIDDRFFELTVVKRRGVASRAEALYRAGEVLEALGLAQLTYPHDPLARGLELLERSNLPQSPVSRLFRATRAAMRQPLSAQLQLRLGNELLANGLEEEAAAAFEKATELEEQGAIRHLAARNLGQLRLRQGRVGEAREWFETAIDAQPDWAFWPLLGLGEALLRQGDRSGAEAAFARAANDEAHPDRIVAVKRLAAFYREDGRLHDARELLTRYLAHSPRDPRGWLEYGDVLSALGSQGEAEFAYRRTVELEAMGALAYEAAMRLGNAANARGERAQALEWYAVARERQPAWTFWPSLARAAVFRQAGQFAEAEREIQRALAVENNPDRFVALAELALLRAAEGRAEEAQSLAVQVLALGGVTPEVAERMRALLRP